MTDADSPLGVDARALAGSAELATVETHESLGSTNDRARELFAQGAELPALVVARRQTAGRGRGTNRWWSAEGALTFSLAVGPETPRPDQPGLTSLLTALALVEAIQKCAGVAARVKWPNDVVIGRRKAAGVLLESPRPGRLVAGIGLNLNNSLDQAPADVRERSIAVAAVAGRRVPPTDLLLEFVRAWPDLLREAQRGDPRPMQRVAIASALTGAAVVIDQPDGARIEGTATGVAPEDGALLVQAHGGVRRIASGTITHWQSIEADQAEGST